MSIEMPMGEWKKQTPDLHLDPQKEVDPVEKVIEQFGPEGAIEELTSQLEQNPGNPELLRQANLLVNRYDDLVNKLRSKISH